MRACSGATHHLRVVGGVHSGAVEQEAHASEGLSLTLAEGVHELLQLGGALDLEEDLVVVVGNLDIQVLALTTIFGLLLNIWGTVVGHFGGFGGLGFGQRSGCA